MQYFSLEFWFDRSEQPHNTLISTKEVFVHINMALDDKQEGKLLGRAMKKAGQVLDDMKIEYIHQYAWPGDGNFYFYARGDIDLKTFTEKLKKGYETAQFFKVEVTPTVGSARRWSGKDSPTLQSCFEHEGKGKPLRPPNRPEKPGKKKKLLER